MPFDVYKHADAYATGSTVNTYFVAESMDPITSYYGAKLYPDYTFANAPQADILVVPSGLNSMDTDLENTAMISWVSTQAASAEYVTSHCWGAFTLGGAGLLDGKKATTFPGYFEDLDSQFPAIDQVVTTRRIVHDGNVITSNGGLAAGEASLYVMGLVFGEQLVDNIAYGLVFADQNLQFAKDPYLVP